MTFRRSKFFLLNERRWVAIQLVYHKPVSKQSSPGTSSTIKILVIFTLVFSDQFILETRYSMSPPQFYPQWYFSMNLSQEQVLQRDPPQFYSHQYFPINLYNPETNSTIPTLVLFTFNSSDQSITGTNSTIPTLVIFTLIFSDQSITGTSSTMNKEIFYNLCR